MRATELCHLMPSAQVAELAAKYAMKLGRSLLSERVSTIVSSKREKEESRFFSSRSRSPDLFASQSQSQGRGSVCMLGTWNFSKKLSAGLVF